MRVIPLAPIPNQSLSVRLDGARMVLRLKEARGVMVADLEREGVVILSGVRVLAGEAIIPYDYLEDGNFLLQTLNDELPDWREFGKSQTLLYIGRDEVLALREPAPMDWASIRKIRWWVPPETPDNAVFYAGDVVTQGEQVVTYSGE